MEKQYRLLTYSQSGKSGNQPNTSPSSPAAASSPNNVFDKTLKELKEQLRLVRLENAARNLLPTNNSDTHQQSQQPLIDLSVRVCSCNGVCSTKKCSWVNKNVRCNPDFCRCQDGCTNKVTSNDNENKNNENSEESSQIEHNYRTVNNKKDQKKKKTENIKGNKKCDDESKRNNKKSDQPNQADNSTNTNLPNVNVNKNHGKTLSPANTSALIVDTSQTSQSENDVQLIENNDDEVEDREGAIHPLQPRLQLQRRPFASCTVSPSFNFNGPVNHSTINQISTASMTMSNSYHQKSRKRKKTGMSINRN